MAGLKLGLWMTVALLGTAVAAQERNVPAPAAGITVYEDEQFGGRSRTFTIDVANLGSAALNDRISSLIVAAGETWEICVDRNYEGECTIVSNREPNLNDVGWNDRISSIRRVRGRGGAGRGSQPTPFQRLELFAGSNYTGERKVVAEPADNFRDIDFNDRALSVRLIGGGSWEICVNADFDNCRLVSADVPDLRTIGVDRQISSARPRDTRNRLDRGIVLYAAVGFSGRSLAVDQARGSLGTFNDQARSVRVAGGRWELCDAVNFGGNCVTISSDVPDLRRFGLNEQVRSVRPR